jgi:hypothetical protein
MIVFKLQHAHLDPAYDDVSEIFDIGIYSSRSLAEAAAARLMHGPDFQMYRTDFRSPKSRWTRHRGKTDMSASRRLI